MPPPVLSEDEVQQLQALASSRSLPHSIVHHAQIVLACGPGVTSTAIARRMGLTRLTVGKWRKRYRELGLDFVPISLVGTELLLLRCIDPLILWRSSQSLARQTNPLPAAGRELFPVTRGP